MTEYDYLNESLGGKEKVRLYYLKHKQGRVKEVSKACNLDKGLAQTSISRLKKEGFLNRVRQGYYMLSTERGGTGESLASIAFSVQKEISKQNINSGVDVFFIIHTALKPIVDRYGGEEVKKVLEFMLKK